MTTLDADSGGEIVGSFQMSKGLRKAMFAFPGDHLPSLVMCKNEKT